MSWTVPADVPLVSDAAETLSALTKALGPYGEKDEAGSLRRPQASRTRASETSSAAGGWRGCRANFSRRMPSSPATRGRTGYSSCTTTACGRGGTGGGGMGYAVPAVLAAARLFPERQSRSTLAKCSPVWE